MKNNMIVETETREVKYLGPTVEGKKHDKKLADIEAVQYPNGSVVSKDTGFQGYEPEGTAT